MHGPPPRHLPWACLLLAGCAFPTAVPQARVRRGPAYAQVVTPLAALPVTCAEVRSRRLPAACTPGRIDAVASAARLALEFDGHGVVDTERINVLARHRTTVTHDEATARPAAPQNPLRPPPSSGDSVTMLEGGATWSDAPADQRSALLAAMGVHGLLAVRITVGPARGASAEQTVTAQVTVSRLAPAQLVWESRCSAETGDYHSVDQAFDIATRCALESPSLW